MTRPRAEKKPKSIMRRVVRADRSPMNPKRWCLELECGHEEWVNGNARPQREKSKCGVCTYTLPTFKAADG